MKKFWFEGKHPSDAPEDPARRWVVEAPSKEEAIRKEEMQDWDGLYGPPICIGEIKEDETE